MTLRVIRRDQDRQIRPWHSCGDPGDLRGGRLLDTMQRNAIVFIVKARGLNGAPAKSRFMADKALCCETKLSSDAVVRNESYAS